MDSIKQSPYPKALTLIAEQSDKNESQVKISPDNRQLIIDTLASLPQTRTSVPPSFWHLVSKLHLQAYQDKNGELTQTLSDLIKPYLSQLKPNCHVQLPQGSSRPFNSLVLHQMPFFERLFKGQFAVATKEERNSTYVRLKNDEVAISALQVIVEHARTGNISFDNYGFVKLMILMRTINYLYAGYQYAPDDLKARILEKLSSEIQTQNLPTLIKMADSYQLDLVPLIVSAIRTSEDLKNCQNELQGHPEIEPLMDEVLPKLIARIIAPVPDDLTLTQYLDWYSLAHGLNAVEVQNTCVEQLANSITTPDELTALYDLLCSERYSHLLQRTPIKTHLNPLIMLTKADYGYSAALNAYRKGVVLQQPQWRTALASSLLVMDDELAFIQLEKTLSDSIQPDLLSEDLDALAQQHLLSKVKSWFDVIGDRFDIDTGIPIIRSKKKKALTRQEQTAIANLQRFGKIASSIKAIDHPVLENVSHQNVAWLLSKVSPMLKVANLSGSEIQNEVPFAHLSHLSELILRDCFQLQELNLTDILNKLTVLDLSHCENLSWQVGKIGQKSALTHLLVRDVDIGRAADLLKFPVLHTVDIRGAMIDRQELPDHWKVTA